MQGASAIEKLLDEQHDSRIRVFVIWEPVLATDLGAPSTATLRRASDLRVSQYWDKEHIVSRLLGERDRASVVWDHVAVYQPGKLWDQAPPDPVYSRVPVIRGIDGAKDAVRQLLRGTGLLGKERFPLGRSHSLRSVRALEGCTDCILERPGFSNRSGAGEVLERTTLIAGATSD